jgi:CBS domain-containing protein
MTEETVAEIMDTRVRTLDSGSTVRDCAQKMAKESADSIVLVREGVPVGIMTERDLVVKILADGFSPDKVRAQDIMSTPLITVSPHATMTDAAKLMSVYKIRRLVVVDDEHVLVGMVTSDDLAKVLAKKRDYQDPALNVMGRVNETPTSGPYQ